MGKLLQAQSQQVAFSYLDYLLWQMLWKWSLRRHPKKGKGWVAQKYFRTSNGAKFHLAQPIKSRNGRETLITLPKLSNIPIIRHVKVKGTASPDDPTLTKYWQDRQSKYGKSYGAKGSKLYNVAVNQDWKCPVCGEHLFNGEELHTHHKIRVKNGGTDKAENLVHLHKACHWHEHASKRSEALEAGAG